MNTLRTLALAAFFLLPLSLFGQVDTEFWFAAPEVDAGHGDKPISLQVTTLDQPATVVIDMPANQAFPTQTLNISPNSLKSLDLTPYIDLLENRPANQVLKKGLRITSTAPITAYYEVKTSCNCNPDIFPLKGQNALGTDFWVIFQNRLPNALGTSSFDIVATEDGTVIEITPSKPIVGHSANQTFKVELNRGETYSATATGTAASSHLSGSKITSNKPIAITLKDDSIKLNNCWDLVGEQMVPVNLAGQEYIVMRGYLGTNSSPIEDMLFILATEDGTTVNIAGSNVATLNAGETYSYSVGADYTYIKTSAPTHVLHITGFGCEVGGSILPSINCTGSQQVSFTRSTNEFFAVNVMVRAENVGGFTFQGGNIQAGNFETVPNTSGDWVVARVELPSATVGQGLQLRNSLGNFHLGVINGQETTGCRYGYFSSYSRLLVEVTANKDVFCPGETLLLQGEIIEGGEYSWEGPNGFAASTTQVEIQDISMDQAGIYSLQVTQDNCTSEIANTSIEVLDLPTPSASVNASSTNICRGDEVTLEAAGSNLPEGVRYEWIKNGAVFAGDQPSIKADDLQNGDQVSLKVYLPDTDAQCLDSDVLETETLSFTVSEPVTATVAISPSLSVLCMGDEVTFSSTVENAGEPLYQWHINEDPVPGATESTFTTSGLNPGDKVYLRVTDTSPCAPRPQVNSSTASLEVLEKPSAPEISGIGPVCAGETIALEAADAPNSGLSYEWTAPSGEVLGGASINIDNAQVADAGTYQVVAIREVCTSEPSEVEVQVDDPAEPSVAIEASAPEICIGDQATFTANVENAPSTGMSYQWTLNGEAVGGNTESFASSDLRSGDELGLLLKFSGEAETRCYAFTQLGASPISVTVLDPPAAGVEISASIGTVCLGDPVRFQANTSNAGASPSYQWMVNGSAVGENQASFETTSLNDGDLVSVSVDVAQACTPTPEVSSNEVSVNVQTKPEISLEERYEYCPEEEAGIALDASAPGATIYEWQPTGETAASVFIDAPGEYSVRAATPSGCFSERDIEVLATCPMEVYVPNAFSPNGDGKNDVFKLFGKNIESIDFRIYNRWGEVVFAAEGLEDTWDGVYKGEVVPAGSYFWHIECVPIDKKQPRQSLKGEMQIFRN